MSLHTPYFFLKEDEDGNTHVTHNSSGCLDFPHGEIINKNTKRLIELAIAEGMRRKAEDIKELLGI